jgi:hypothetical protein
MHSTPTPQDLLPSTRAETDSNDGVRVVTLGCRLNAYESEVMRRHAVDAGLGDTVVINTCAVTAEAVRQAAQTIRKARRDNPQARIVVTGCAAQIEPGRFAAMPEVNAVIGNAEKMRRETFEGLGTSGSPRVLVNDIMSVREECRWSLRVRLSVCIPLTRLAHHSFNLSMRVWPKRWPRALPARFKMQNCSNRASATWPSWKNASLNGNRQKPPCGKAKSVTVSCLRMRGTPFMFTTSKEITSG